MEKTIERRRWKGRQERINKGGWGVSSSQPSDSGACKDSARVAQISYWCMDGFTSTGWLERKKNKREKIVEGVEKEEE